MEKSYMPHTDIYNGCVNCKNNVTIPSCIDDDFCIATPMPRTGGILAMAFVDMQPIDGVYPEATAFCNGTLFPNLNMPFYGGNKR